MAKIHFYLDQIMDRDFSIDAVELISAPFDYASIYCLQFKQGILGPIAKRKIIAASAFLEKSNFYKKLPLLSLSLKLPAEKSSVVVVSRGMLACSSHCKTYYFYAPYWESDDYIAIKTQQSWLIRKWLDYHEKKVIKSLQQNQNKVITTSQSLATKYHLKKARVLYPFFKSEDFPRVELAVEKRAITIYLKGVSEDKLEQLILYLKDLPIGWSCFLFGDENDRRKFLEFSFIRFESQFCSATLQAAFLQSVFFFQFHHEEELSFALGALASGTYVAHLNAPILMEVIPQGLLLLCHEVKDIVHMTNYWGNVKHLLDVSEARRFALRFSEKNFKDKFLKIMSED